MTGQSIAVLMAHHSTARGLTDRAPEVPERGPRRAAARALHAAALRLDPGIATAG